MAFCVNCGTKLADGARFCPSCGTPAGGVAPTQSKNVTVGQVRKCPACGADVPSMATVCASCGHEFSGTQASSAVQAFFNKLDALDQGYGNSAQKISLIEGFPIPTTKEDLLEFVITATSRIDYRKMTDFDFFSDGMAQFQSAQDFNKAWRAKIQQASSKAILTGDKALLSQIETIIAENEKLGRKQARLSKSGKNRIILTFIKSEGGKAVLGFLAFAVFVGIMGLVMSLMPNASKETKRLNKLAQEIVIDIENGDFTNARTKARGLIWELDPAGFVFKREVAQWEQRQQQLLEQIEAASGAKTENEE